MSLILTSVLALAALGAAPVEAMVGRALTDYATPDHDWGQGGPQRCSRELGPEPGRYPGHFLCILEPKGADGSVTNFVVFGDTVVGDAPAVPVEIIRGALRLPPVLNQRALHITPCARGGRPLVNTIALFRWEASPFSAGYGSPLGPLLRLWSYDPTRRSLEELPIAGVDCRRPI